jgi:hypothetical protein
MKLKKYDEFVEEINEAKFFDTIKNIADVVGHFTQNIGAISDILKPGKGSSTSVEKLKDIIGNLTKFSKEKSVIMKIEDFESLEKNINNIIDDLTANSKDSDKSDIEEIKSILKEYRNQIK